MEYTYLITNCNVEKLNIEVREDETLAPKFSHMDTKGANPFGPSDCKVRFTFTSDLTAGEIIILDALVQAHDSSPLIRTHAGRFANTLWARKEGATYTIEVPCGPDRAGIFKATLSDNLSVNLAGYSPVAYTTNGFILEIQATDHTQPIDLDFAWEIERA